MVLPLITPLLLLKVGLGTYILNKIINPNDDDDYDDGNKGSSISSISSSSSKREECITDHDEIRSKIDKIQKFADYRLRLTLLNRLDMENQHKDTWIKRRPIVGKPEQRIRKIPIVDEALISMLKPT